MLEIHDLHVEVVGRIVLKGFNLFVGKGEVHALMGPNGAGKSTLAKVVAGHSAYVVTEGSILLDGEDLLALSPEERALKGVFMSFQYPPEIAGLKTETFLLEAVNAGKKARGEPLLSTEQFASLLAEKMRLLQMKEEFGQRGVNEGFSGGEKKRHEIVQMALLAPRLAFLDETDSGLDIDAMRVVASAIRGQLDGERSLILITHYQRLLDYLPPDHVHIVKEGRIVESGGPGLAQVLEARGYEFS